jgi:hypothetical protein
MRQAMGRQWTLNRTSSRIGDKSIKGIRQAMNTIQDREPNRRQSRKGMRQAMDT